MSNYTFTYLPTYLPMYILTNSFQETCIIDYRGRTIWVWLGKKASNKDRIDAIRNAHGFVKKKNYPTHTPICKVIEGGEPLEFKCLFSSWQEQDLNNNVNNCLGK